MQTSCLHLGPENPDKKNYLTLGVSILCYVFLKKFKNWTMLCCILLLFFFSESNALRGSSLKQVRDHIK